MLYFCIQSIQRKPGHIHVHTVLYYSHRGKNHRFKSCNYKKAHKLQKNDITI
jgi:hypothetical protein